MTSGACNDETDAGRTNAAGPTLTRSVYQPYLELPEALALRERLGTVSARNAAGRDLHLRHGRHAVIAVETRRAAGKQLFGAQRRHGDELVRVGRGGTRYHCEFLQAMVRNPRHAGCSEQLGYLSTGLTIAVAV